MADYQFNTNLGPAQQQGTNIGDMINLARGVQAYQQSQQTNPLEVQRLKANVSQAETEAEKSKFGLASGKYDKAAQIAGASATDKILQGLIDKKDASGITDYFGKKMGELKRAGFSESEALSSIAPLVTLAHQNPQHIIPTLENLSTQAVAPATQVGLQTGDFEKNAAGQFVLTNKARNTVTPSTNVGITPQPTNADVELGNQYSKDLSGRVSASNQVLQRTEELKDLTGAFKAGAGTQTMANIASKLQAIGAPQDLVDKVAGGDLSAVQSYNKFLSQSVISGVRQAAGAGGEARVAEIENYLKNNPSVNTDPRALQRFIDFSEKLAKVDLAENAALAQAKKEGTYNPGTWQNDWQQIAQKEGLLPKTPKVSGSVSGERKVVRSGKYNGRTVVEYSDGTVEYK